LFPVFEYWQYWRNCEDRDTGRFLRLFTELPLDEIARLEALGGTEINEAKKVLATEATAMVHGRKAALQAAGAARKTFEAPPPSGRMTPVGNDSVPHSANYRRALPSITDTVGPLPEFYSSSSLPSIEIPAAEIEAGLGVLTAFVRSGLVGSTGEARRQIIGGGLKINDRTVTDERMVIGPRDLTGGVLKLSLGRKRHVLLKVA
ncbi:MAG: hypothetical protein M3Z96_14155, partial [Pseudomonadota bacterium]|nr:hypothetical protein [Pseudomonadota bacterium]